MAYVTTVAPSSLDAPSGECCLVLLVTTCPVASTVLGGQRVPGNICPVDEYISPHVVGMACSNVNGFFKTAQLLSLT